MDKSNLLYINYRQKGIKNVCFFLQVLNENSNFVNK